MNLEQILHGLREELEAELAEREIEIEFYDPDTCRCQTHGVLDLLVSVNGQTIGGRIKFPMHLHERAEIKNVKATIMRTLEEMVSFLGMDQEPQESMLAEIIAEAEHLPADSLGRLVFVRNGQIIVVDIIIDQEEPDPMAKQAKWN